MPLAGSGGEAVLNVENVEEVGITTDTSMAGLDISQLGLPTAITDILNSANGYGRYKINVMISKSLSSVRWKRPGRPWRMQCPRSRIAPLRSSCTA